MSCCPSQSCTCENEVTQDHKVHKASAMKVCTCQASLLPGPEVDQSDIPNECPDLRDLCTNNDSADNDNSVEDPIEDGDWILVATIPPQKEFTQASSTTL